MITVSMRDYRGCGSARVTCDPIGLVAGRNAQGKSSLAQGVSIALCGEVPKEFGRSPGPSLVKTGAEVGLVEVQGDEGVVRMEFPKMQRSVEGNHPAASQWAAGLVSVADLSAKERAEELSTYLHAMPTQDDVTVALGKVDLVQHAEAVWELIERHGWDGAERLRRERGAEMKGGWRQLTGANYGSRIAATWRPDLAELNESELVVEVRRCETLRDRAIAAAAVSEEEHKRIQTLVAEHDLRHDAYVQAAGAVEIAEVAYRRAQEERGALPPATQPKYVECPYCQAPIEVIRDLAAVRLEKATGEIIKDETLKARRKAIAEADGKLAHANDALMLARRKLSEAQIALTASQDAQTRLERWPRATESGTDLEAAKAALGRAEKKLGEFRTKLEADTIHQRIEINDTVIGLLAGDGLRRAKLAMVLAAFNNETLASLTEWAGWSPVAVDEGMTITYGGRVFGLLSASEKYRVRVVLQIAMAQIEGASLMVIDGADILDAPARSGLLLMLHKVGIPTLLCQTASKPDQVPDLTRHEMGNTYWLDGGVTQERVAA